MAPTAIHDVEVDRVNLADLKAKVVEGHVEVEETPKAPLPENFMYDFKYNHPLPTIDSLGRDIPADIVPSDVAQGLLEQISSVLERGDASGFTGLFVDYGVWRDKLAYSWDFRTFNFRDNIARAAADLLPSNRAKNIHMITPAASIDRPYPDVAYLQFHFSLDTDLVNASVAVNAVYTADGWKLWTLHTVAESLLQFPELPPYDGHMTGDISWERQRQLDDDQIEPEVLVVGGGQCGLAIAARLKVLGVKTLIVERSAEIGEVWRKRYEYLSLHHPHWSDHFPYIHFPDHWPTYTPAQKLGIFMQWYATAMELPIWTSSQVVSAKNDNGDWTVDVSKGGKETRTLKPKHVVMATSLCGVPMSPVIPGASEFGGIIRHSTAHDSSRDFVGKKVLVVGTSSSGFDTAYDCARRGIDVTLLQRSPTYVMSLTHSMPRLLAKYEPKNGVRPDLEAVDRSNYAMPNGPAEELGRRNAEVLEKLDADLLAGLNAKGLRTWRGQRGTGQNTLGQTRNGGFYFDAGACEQIINGNIKVEPGYIEKFEKDKVILSGGREREYDLVVYATGFSNTIDSVRNILGDEVADQCGPIWGVDEEGEMKGAYRESGAQNLWVFVGYLPLSRYHSKRLAIRIKALLEGIAPAPYKV